MHGTFTIGDGYEGTHQLTVANTPEVDSGKGEVELVISRVTYENGLAGKVPLASLVIKPSHARAIASAILSAATEAW